jgi:hypothetical protein
MMKAMRGDKYKNRKNMLPIFRLRRILDSIKQRFSIFFHSHPTGRLSLERKNGLVLS